MMRSASHPDASRASPEVLPSGAPVCAGGGGVMPGICALAKGKTAGQSTQNSKFFRTRVRITVFSPRLAAIAHLGHASGPSISKRFSSILLHTNMPLESARPLPSLCVPKFHLRARLGAKIEHGDWRATRGMHGGWDEPDSHLDCCSGFSPFASFCMDCRAVRCCYLGASANRTTIRRSATARAASGTNSASAEAAGRRALDRG